MICSTEETLRRVRERRARPGWPLSVNAAIAMSAGTDETTQIGSGPQDRQRGPSGIAQNQAPESNK